MKMRISGNFWRAARIQSFGFWLIIFASCFAVRADAQKIFNFGWLYEPTPFNWRLLDGHSTICYDGQSTGVFFRVQIRGSWTKTVDVWVDNLPKNASFATIAAPISPGSSNGEDTLAFVNLQFDNSIPRGTYTSTLLVSDGGSIESVPITVKVRNVCGY